MLQRYFRSILAAGAATLLSSGWTMSVRATEIAQWNLNEGSGGSVNPTIGNITGVVNNTNWVSGGPPATNLNPVVSPSVHLETAGAVGSNVSFTDTSANDNTNNSILTPSSMTIAFWAKSTGPATNVAGHILASKYTNENTSRSYEIAFGNSGGGDLFFRRFTNGSNSDFTGLGADSGGTATTTYTATQFSDGNWHFIAVSFNQSNGNALSETALYADGNLIEDTQDAPMAIDPSSAPLMLGQRPYPGAEAPAAAAFGGPLMIFDSALSQSDIQSLMQVSSAPEPASMGLILGGGALLFGRRRRR